MKNQSGWKKSGWRSLLHRSYPKAVVRFSGERGTIKLLMNPQDFVSSEVAAGRVPDATLREMQAQAEAVWKELNENGSDSNKKG